MHATTTPLVSNACGHSAALDPRAPAYSLLHRAKVHVDDVVHEERLASAAMERLGNDLTAHIQPSPITYVSACARQPAHYAASVRGSRREVEPRKRRLQSVSLDRIFTQIAQTEPGGQICTWSLDDRCVPQELHTYSCEVSKYRLNRRPMAAFFAREKSAGCDCAVRGLCLRRRLRWNRAARGAGCLCSFRCDR